MEIDVPVQPQFLGLYHKEWQEYAIKSGRGAGKSWAVADYLIVCALAGDARILCVREIQNSINDSVLKLISDRIVALGLSDFFDVQKAAIYCKINKSEFIFKGLRHNIDSIKSMEGITHAWIEEAQNASQASFDTLLPTIFRVKGAKIIYTYNPRYATDAVYKRFNSGAPPKNSIVSTVSSEDNIYFTEAMREERRFAFAKDPEVANHIWNGALCPTSSAMSVIPLAWLRKCVDAHKKLKYGASYEYIGFDVADTGEDHCALAHIRGALVHSVLEFDSDYISRSVDFVHRYAQEHNILRVYYDASGIGAGAKSDFNRINDRQYSVEAFLGAAKVGGGDICYTGSIKNKDYFRNKKAQAWWSVRQRAENTLRLLDGDKIDPAKCLFLSSNIKELDRVMLELAQASYKHDDGKLIVDKQPNDEASPNCADAIVMAFSRSIKNGLKSR